MPEGKYFWLRSHLNNLCLDLSYGKAEDGNNVITWEYREAPHQLWYEDLANHVIRSKADENLVLEERDGQVIIAFFHRGKDEQQWEIQEGRVCKRNDNDRVLHIKNGQEEHAAHLTVERYEGKAEHSWDAVHLDSPYFVIMSMMNNKAVDIEAGDSSTGANVIMYDHHGNDNQQWYEDKHGFIRSKLNGYTINTRDGHAEMDDIEIGSSGCCWVLNGNAIVNRYQPDECLEIQDCCEDNCAKVVPGHNNENPHQRWIINPVE